MFFESLFKALGEGTRIRIVKLLSVKPMYVCELEAILQISQPRISQHLRILKHAGLLDSQKDGQRTIYSLNQSAFDEICSGFQRFLAQPLKNLPEFQQEMKRIHEVANDPSIAICKNQGCVTMLDDTDE